jgi:hypothetical protein
MRGELILPSSFGVFPRYLVAEERQKRPSSESLLENQPFLHQGLMNPIGYRTAQLAREAGKWADMMDNEQTAYALAQVSAANILPPLVDLEDGNALLEYCVTLRDHLDGALVDELVSILDMRAAEFHWSRVEATVYASVIGAGVAACIDTTRTAERLYLRYANTLAAEFFVAGRAAEMPRSRLFLQTALHERLDTLLQQTRTRTWFWLSE